MLLERPSLRTTHIKQNWQKNVITFRSGKMKVRVPTQPCAGTSKELTPLYAESINMLDGLTDDEVDWYLDEHPKIVLLFEVDIAEAIIPYVVHSEEVLEELDREAIRELRQAPVSCLSAPDRCVSRAGTTEVLD